MRENSIFMLNNHRRLETGVVQRKVRLWRPASVNLTTQFNSHLIMIHFPAHLSQVLILTLRLRLFAFIIHYLTSCARNTESSLCSFHTVLPWWGNVMFTLFLSTTHICVSKFLLISQNPVRPCCIVFCLWFSSSLSCHNTFLRPSLLLQPLTHNNSWYQWLAHTKGKLLVGHLEATA